MIISQKKYDAMVKLIEKQHELLVKQNKMIKQGREEVKQAMKLLDLYEACITKGVKIDFPDVTGRVKGGNTQPGTEDIDFSDF